MVTTMSIDQAIVAVVLGTVGSLLATAVLWAFRRQIRDTLSRLDMTAGAAFGWLMAFAMLVVMVIFPLVDKDVPDAVSGVFPVLVAMLVVVTAANRR